MTPLDLAARCACWTGRATIANWSGVSRAVIPALAVNPDCPVHGAAPSCAPASLAATVRNRLSGTQRMSLFVADQEAPMIPLDLAAIGARAEAAGDGIDCDKPGANVALQVTYVDVPALIAEIEALRGQVAALTAASCCTSRCSR